mmetsp:Transcript_3705/g.17061  ORF Transcript_3705/g.17061 Transcript_3705/m.17061 type:complete len:217 (-) Transcript_3705:219-869(-)
MPASRSFAPEINRPGAWRITAHTREEAAEQPDLSRGRSLASMTRPLWRAQMRSKTASESPRLTACGVSTGAAGKRSVPASPSRRKSRRRAIAAGASRAMSSSTCRSMSSTSRRRHMPSSIMILAASRGSCSRRRPPLRSPSASSRPPPPSFSPFPEKSRMGLGARMLENGTRPMPSSATKAVGALASFACGASSRRVSGAKGSRSLPLLLPASHDW